MSNISSSYQRDANREPITNLGLIETKAITYVAGTTGATGATNLFTITGEVAVRIFAKCTVDLNSDGGATIEAGIAGNTASLIAQTGLANIDAGTIWLDATLATVKALPAQQILVGGTNIIQTIGTAALKAGVLTYYCLWTPISTDGNVSAA